MYMYNRRSFMCIYAKTIKWTEIILNAKTADVKEWFWEE